MIRYIRTAVRKIASIVLSLAIVISMVFGSGTIDCKAAEKDGLRVITGAADLDSSVSDIHLTHWIEEEYLMSMLPDELEVLFSDGTVSLVPVSWVTAEDYSAGDMYFYLFDPVFDGLEVASDVNLPYVVVWIDGVDNASVMSVYADDGEETSGDDTGTDNTSDDQGDSGNNDDSGEENTSNDENSSGEDNNSGDDENSDEEEEETHLQDLIRDVEVDREANELEIYEYLRNELGLNEAASVGVLANINAESGYRQNALGDKNSEGYFTSYGLCQWHNTRWEKLIQFGTDNDVDWQTVHGQMMYLQYELEHGYRGVLAALRAVENTDQGAYEAGYIFCAKFEVPANTAQRADARGRVARDKFWPRFGRVMSLDKSELNIYVGDTAQLTVSGVSENEVSWYVELVENTDDTPSYTRLDSVSDQDIIRLSASGEVVGLKPGNVRIVAGYGNQEEYCNVRVEEAPRDREMVDEGILFRLYNPNSGEHFWTGSLEERNNLIAAGWNYEGAGWIAPKTYGDPVYRLYNEEKGDHHYTKDPEEMQLLVDSGWNYEGVAWSSEDESVGKPLYRLYNPNAESEGKAGAHFWTMSEQERDNLVTTGWVYEGIGWYGA